MKWSEAERTEWVSFRKIFGPPGRKLPADFVCLSVRFWSSFSQQPLNRFWRSLRLWVVWSGPVKFQKKNLKIWPLTSVRGQMVKFRFPELFLITTRPIWKISSVLDSPSNSPGPEIFFFEIRPLTRDITKKVLKHQNHALVWRICAYYSAVPLYGRHWSAGVCLALLLNTFKFFSWTLTFDPGVQGVQLDRGQNFDFFLWGRVGYRWIGLGSGIKERYVFSRNLTSDPSPGSRKGSKVKILIFSFGVVWGING